MVYGLVVVINGNGNGFLVCLVVTVVMVVVSGRNGTEGQL